MSGAAEQEPAPTGGAFGAMVEARWRDLGLSQAEFCRLVSMPAGWVQQIRKGTKTPPLDRMELWASALELKGAQKQLFLDLAAVQHLPEAARQRFLSIATRANGGAG